MDTTVKRGKLTDAPEFSFFDIFRSVDKNTNERRGFLDRLGMAQDYGQYYGERLGLFLRGLVPGRRPPEEEAVVQMADNFWRGKEMKDPEQDPFENSRAERMDSTEVGRARVFSDRVYYTPGDASNQTGSDYVGPERQVPKFEGHWPLDRPDEKSAPVPIEGPNKRGLPAPEAALEREDPKAVTRDAPPKALPAPESAARDADAQGASGRDVPGTRTVEDRAQRVAQAAQAKAARADGPEVVVKHVKKRVSEDQR